MEAIARALEKSMYAFKALGNSSYVSLRSVKASASSGHNSFSLDLKSTFPKSRQTLRCEFDYEIKF